MLKLQQSSDIWQIYCIRQPKRFNQNSSRKNNCDSSKSNSYHSKARYNIAPQCNKVCCNILQICVLFVFKMHNTLLNLE
ncbi:hypothetical protein BpHYR1_043152 [Brachionus plicatilis]|uniref:Uncharacterized protein n=1 Tax=Brachionus plicatilis TaxID=10195 RepID=A0A3M7RNV9_BRAPC|nr:hypothetical protein BpHYR1_043152 [Brachionus plicatilis]